MSGSTGKKNKVSSALEYPDWTGHKKDNLLSEDGISAGLIPAQNIFFLPESKRALKKDVKKSSAAAPK